MTIQIYQDGNKIMDMKTNNDDEVLGMMVLIMSNDLNFSVVYNDETYTSVEDLSILQEQNVNSKYLNNYDYNQVKNFGIFVLNSIDDLEPLFNVYHFESKDFIKGMLKISTYFDIYFKDYVYCPFFDRQGQLYDFEDDKEYYFSYLWPRKQPETLILPDDLYLSGQVEIGQASNYIQSLTYSDMYEPILQDYRTFEPYHQKDILRYDNDPINKLPYYREEGQDDELSFENMSDDVF